MKFGQSENPELIDFRLPEDDPRTFDILKQNDKSKPLSIYVGCAKWNKTDLKNFYPRGTKDELTYYSTQFNSIELNATFYNMPSRQQVITWREKTPEHFRFFPKITQSISHMRRLNDVQSLTTEYCDNISNFEDKLFQRVTGKILESVYEPLFLECSYGFRPESLLFLPNPRPQTKPRKYSRPIHPTIDDFLFARLVVL